VSICRRSHAFPTIRSGEPAKYISQALNELAEVGGQIRIKAAQDGHLSGGFTRRQVLQRWDQKKMLTFFGSSTFWSRRSLRRAIFHAPSTRRRMSCRAPTYRSCSVSARVR
jgi:hypothetical protein